MLCSSRGVCGLFFLLSDGVDGVCGMWAARVGSCNLECFLLKVVHMDFHALSASYATPLAPLKVILTLHRVVPSS